MGETDRLPEVAAARRRRAGRCRCACSDWQRGLRAVPADDARSRRPAAAWTAASRSATTAARSATSSPTGTTSSTATTGATRSSGCTPPTTSPSSPGGSARRRARRRACSASTRTRSRSSRSRSRSSTGPGREGWVAPVHADGADRQAGRGRRLRARPGSPPRSSSRAPGTTSSCSSGPTASAACCATASPSSRWRSATSTAGSTQMRGRGHRVPGRTSNVGRRRRPSTSCAPSSTRSCSPAARPRLARPADPRPRARAASTRRWSTCRSRNRVQQGDLDDAADHRRRASAS